MTFNPDGHARIFPQQLHGLLQTAYGVAGQLRAVGREVDALQTEHHMAADVVDPLTARGVRTLVPVVGNAVAVRIPRTAAAVHAHAPRRVRALIQTVDDAVAVAVGGTSGSIDPGAARRIRASITAVRHAVAIAVPVGGTT